MERPVLDGIQTLELLSQDASLVMYASEGKNHATASFSETINATFASTLLLPHLDLSQQ